MANNSASKMSDSTIKVKLKEAEEDPKKQFEMLESSSLPQAIADTKDGKV